MKLEAADNYYIEETLRLLTRSFEPSHCAASARSINDAEAVQKAWAAAESEGARPLILEGQSCHQDMRCIPKSPSTTITRASGLFTQVPTILDFCT